MARATSNKAAVLETEETEDVTVEQTSKQVINEGIDRVIEATGVDSQKARYKAMRAIAYTAFVNAIEDGTFDQLVEDAIAGADDLPSGWELERTPKADAPKAPAKRPAATKAPAKTAAKSAPAKTPRRRPTR